MGEKKYAQLICSNCEDNFYLTRIELFQRLEARPGQPLRCADCRKTRPLFAEDLDGVEFDEEKNGN